MVDRDRRIGDGSMVRCQRSIVAVASLAVSFDQNGDVGHLVVVSASIWCQCGASVLVRGAFPSNRWRQYGASDFASWRLYQ